MTTGTDGIIRGDLRECFLATENARLNYEYARNPGVEWSGTWQPRTLGLTTSALVIQDFRRVSDSGVGSGIGASARPRRLLYPPAAVPTRTLARGGDDAGWGAHERRTNVSKIWGAIGAEPRYSGGCPSREAQQRASLQIS